MELTQWVKTKRNPTLMIEKTHSKFIADHDDAQMRRALFDADVPADNNVVPLAR